MRRRSMFRPLRTSVPQRGALSALLLSLILSQGRPARADEQSKAPDKSGYSLLAPTPDSALRDFSPDRPTKISSPITVDAGRVQLESDFASYTRSQGMRTATGAFEALDPTLKLGLLANVDAEMTLNGYQAVHQTMNGVPRPSMHFSGFGDVFFKAKINLLGNDGGDFAFALIPYVKVPSSSAASLAIGNGVVEGGALAVLQVKLPQDFTLGLQTEGDALKGGNDMRRHANFVDILNLSHPVPGIKELTASAEVFTSVSTDRFTPDMYTADFALAYLLRPSTQLDVGTNLGLNRAAPRYQIYCGIAQRF